MTPQPQQTNPITGSPRTTAGGIIAIIMGGLSLFWQIWGGIHGQPVDPTATTTGIGMIGGGVSLLSASDHATVQAAQLGQAAPIAALPMALGPAAGAPPASGGFAAPPPTKPAA